MQDTEAQKNTIAVWGGNYFQLWKTLIKKEINELGPAKLQVFGYIKMIERTHLAEG